MAQIDWQSLVGAKIDRASFQTNSKRGHRRRIEFRQKLYKARGGDECYHWPQTSEEDSAARKRLRPLLRSIVLNCLITSPPSPFWAEAPQIPGWTGLTSRFSTGAKAISYGELKRALAESGTCRVCVLSSLLFLKCPANALTLCTVSC